jgi:His-Xaa-Ser system radical SAM maturase HxsC
VIAGRSDIQWALDAGFQKAATFSDSADDLPFPVAVQLGEQFRHLSDGDLIGVDVSSRRFRTIYRKASRHNSLLVTERCNHYCLMCSQPPKDIDDAWLLEEIAASIPLIDPATPSLGFTGGEPLTDWRRFLEVIALARDALPMTALHVLTNGRAFADKVVAQAWARLNHPNLTAGIPIYSAVDHIHDHVVQASNAFNETLLGVLRLKDLGQRIEIRVVLHALTTPRLIETCEWVARNLPFVNHVALMGLENTGFAIANDAQLWIDPLDYQADLARGARALMSAGVPVSIYNLPLCTVHPGVRHIAVQSISDWKNAYVAECDACSVRSQCAGFFSSGRPKFSRGIAPIASLQAV